MYPISSDKFKQNKKYYKYHEKRHEMSSVLRKSIGQNTLINKCSNHTGCTAQTHHNFHSILELIIS